MVCDKYITDRMPLSATLSCDPEGRSHCGGCMRTEGAFVLGAHFGPIPAAHEAIQVVCDIFITDHLNVIRYPPTLSCDP